MDAGSVNAKLTATDGMSPTIEAVTARIAQLQNQIHLMGGVAGETLNELQMELQASQASLVELQQAAAGASGGLENTGKAARQATGEMDQMDRLATRMVERLLIFYALKETFSFTVGLFEAADALVSMSEKVDMTLGKLQELQYGATQTGVPFGTITTAVDNLDKKLASFSPAVGDMLIHLGTGFDQVLSMNIDQRFDFIANAIGNIKDKAERTKAEMVLFGTDALDPMITKLAELERQARNANAVMGDDTVNQLAAADKAFKNTGDSIKIMAANMLVAAQNATTLMATPLFSGAKTASNYLGAFLSGGIQGGMAFAQAEQTANAGVGAGRSDVSIPPAGTPAPGTGGSNQTGQAYLNSLWAESTAVKTLNDVQRDQLMQLKELDLLDAQHATHLGISTEAVKQFVAEEKAEEQQELKLEVQQKKIAQALADIDAAGSSWRGTLAQMNPALVDFYTNLLAAGVPIKAIEDFFNVSPTRAAALEKNVRAVGQAVLEATKLWDEYDATVEGSGGTLMDQQIAAIDKWAADLTAKMQKAGADTKDFYAALTAVQNQKLTGVITDTKTVTDAVTNDTQRGLQQAADKARNTWQAIVEATGNANSQAALQAEQNYYAAQRAADSWGSNNAEWIDSLVAKQKALTDAVNATNAAQAAGPGGDSFGTKDPALQGTFTIYRGPNGISTSHTLPSHEDGGPTKTGLAMVHDGEFVVPKNGALVMSGAGGGGGDTYHITVPMQGLAVTTDASGLAIIERTVTKAIDSVMRQGRRRPSA